jgi:hypothetical protein
MLRYDICWRQSGGLLRFAQPMATLRSPPLWQSPNDICLDGCENLGNI